MSCCLLNAVLYLSHGNCFSHQVRPDIVIFVSFRQFRNWVFQDCSNDDHKSCKISQISSGYHLMCNAVSLIKKDAGSFRRTSYWTLPIGLFDYSVESVGDTNIIPWAKGISVYSYQYVCCIKYKWRRLYWLELSALWCHIPGEGNYKVVIKNIGYSVSCIMYIGIKEWRT